MRSLVAKILSAALGLVVLSVAGLLVFITVNEYRPEPVETIEVSGSPTKEAVVGESLRFLTFNTGYCCLDEDHDFFMDGGTEVRPDTATCINRNLQAVSEVILRGEYDGVMLQEVDADSKRSYAIDQVAAYSELFPGTAALAVNFDCPYIPYPLPETIGRVYSGIVTLSRFDSTAAERVALPLSYGWPVRTCQLKRCLLVQEIPVVGPEGQVLDEKLILINLHLEAYSSQEAKEKQTAVLLALVEKEYKKGNYVIAGGDFNQSMPMEDLNRYPVWEEGNFVAEPLSQSDLPEGFRYVFDEKTPTCRLLSAPMTQEQRNGRIAGMQLYVIDGYILSDNIQVEEVKTLGLDFRNSDHNPVELQVRLLEGGHS